MGRDKTQLPRHVRAIDFAAARAAEVRRRPDVKSRRAFFSAAPITFRVFLSLLRVPVDEDLTTHPANRGLTRWRQA